MKSLVWVLWGALAVVGCGDDGGGKSAPDKCNDLETRFCGRLADCATELMCEAGATRDQEYQDCLTSIKGSLDCSKAVSVSASYDTCMSDIAAIQCSALGTTGQCMVPTLSANCSKVILVSQ